MKELIYPKWQKQDVERLIDVTQEMGGGSCNWSEMGTMKTTTGLRLAGRLLDIVQQPYILIVTTKSGKGTFLELAPIVFPGATIYVVESQAVYLQVDDGMVKVGKRIEPPRSADIPTLSVENGKLGWEHIDTKNSVPSTPVIFLTHYQLFSSKKDDSQAAAIKARADNKGFDFIWLDEAHRIKERHNTWTKKIKSTALHIPYRHVSTGTGFVNRPDEIWSILNFVNRRRFSSHWAFRKEFCATQDFNGWETIVGVKPERREEFRKLVRGVGVRRTLVEIRPDLPEPTPMNYDVDLSPIQRRMYDEIKRELYVLDQNGVEFRAPNVLTLLSRLRQISVATPVVIDDYYDERQDRRITEIDLVEPSSKLDALFEIIDGLSWGPLGDKDEPRQPVVVFSNFVKPLRLLSKRILTANEKATEHGLQQPYPTIWLKAEDRDDLRYRKWAVEFPKLEHRIFMSTLQLGSESINLTPAQYCIFLDRSWSPLHNMQGVGRIRRPGQTGEPVVININARNTVDQYVEKKVETKMGWFRDIFGEET